MAEKRLRVGFIGAGSHATMCIYPCFRTGAPTIFNRIEMPVEIVAVADLDEDKARRAARDFGAERHYTNHAEMLDAEKLDAAFIVAGAHLHRRLVLDALSRGLAVFVEKPPAENSRETMELVTASREAGRPVMVAFMKRFATAYAMAKRLVASKEFGGEHYVSLKMTGGAGANDGRGFENDYLIHGIDLIHFFGGPVAELTAYPLLADRGFQGYAISFRCENGAAGTAELHGLHGFGLPGERVEISGAGRSCVVDNVMSLRYYRQRTPAWNRPDRRLDPSGDDLSWQPNWTLPRDDNSSLMHLGYIGEVSDFVKSVLGAREPACTVADAHRAMVFIEAMMESDGRPVRLEYGL